MLGKIFPSIKKAEEDSAGLAVTLFFLVKLTPILSQFFQSVKVETYFFFTSDFCHFPQNSVFTLIYSLIPTFSSKKIRCNEHKTANQPPEISSTL